MPAPYRGPSALARCARCQEWLPHAAFAPDRSRWNGYSRLCRYCLAAYHRELNARRPTTRAARRARSQQHQLLRALPPAVQRAIPKPPRSVSGPPPTEAASAWTPRLPTPPRYYPVPPPAVVPPTYHPVRIVRPARQHQPWGWADWLEDPVPPPARHSRSRKLGRDFTNDPDDW
jgi:hypothetical protein